MVYFEFAFVKISRTLCAVSILVLMDGVLRDKVSK